MDWLPLWNDILDSRKVHDLPLNHYKNWTMLLAIANRFDPGGGTLPCIEDIAFQLRCTQEDAVASIEFLVAAEFIDRRDSEFGMHDWHDWRTGAPKASKKPKDGTAAERSRRRRERLKAARENRSDSATSSVTLTVTPSVTDRDATVTSENSKKDHNSNAFFSLFKNESDYGRDAGRDATVTMETDSDVTVCGDAVTPRDVTLSSRTPTPSSPPAPPLIPVPRREDLNTAPPTPLRGDDQNFSTGTEKPKPKKRANADRAGKVDIFLSKRHPKIPESDWSAYGEIRRAKKAIDTERAVNDIHTEIDRLESVGNDPVAVVRQSVRASYVDVYGVKNFNSSVGGQKLRNDPIPPSRQKFTSTTGADFSHLDPAFNN